MRGEMKDAGADAAADDAKDKGKGESEAKAKNTGSRPPVARMPQGGAGADTRKDQPAAAGGSAMRKPVILAQAGAGGGGSVGCDQACRTACEAACGPCEVCGADGKTCVPVTSRDDSDSCVDDRTCSSKGACLYVSEAHADPASKLESAELTRSFAQVITFDKPAAILEIRLAVSCSDGAESFPAVWIVAAPGGRPSDTTIATANVLGQGADSFAVLELSKVLEEPAVGPIAIVAGMSDKSCSVRVNKESPYQNGGLFEQASAAAWAPAEGSMVFEVLSSQ
jgi:hypothetical protein